MNDASREFTDRAAHSPIDSARTGADVRFWKVESGEATLTWPHRSARNDG